MSRLFNYIDELRSRPEPARRRILVFASGGLTLLIALIWLVNLRYVGPLAERDAPKPEVGSQSQVAAPAAGAGELDALERVKRGWTLLRDAITEKFSN